MMLYVLLPLTMPTFPCHHGYCYEQCKIVSIYDVAFNTDSNLTYSLLWNYYVE